MIMWGSARGVGYGPMPAQAQQNRSFPLHGLLLSWGVGDVPGAYMVYCSQQCAQASHTRVQLKSPTAAAGSCSFLTSLRLAALLSRLHPPGAGSLSCGLQLPETTAVAVA